VDAPAINFAAALAGAIANLLISQRLNWAAVKKSGFINDFVSNQRYRGRGLTRSMQIIHASKSLPS
jgi:hypothetical protein